MGLSSTGARALSLPLPSETMRRDSETDSIYAGWLFVEASHTKREFKWRFCVLDDVHFQVYTEEIEVQDRNSARCMRMLVHEHLLTHVERIHRLNRGMLLVDITGYGLWVHGTHDQQYFTHWFTIIQAAVLHQPIRLTISRYGFAHQSSDWSRSAAESSELTGWLLVRRTLLRGWLVGPAHRHYCVLAGRCLSAFKLNLEGRWADIYGKLTSISYAKDTKWIKATLDSGAIVHVQGTVEGATTVWRSRMEAALHQDPVPASERGRGRPNAPQRILTC